MSTTIIRICSDVSAGNMLLLRIWGQDHGPWLQALHLIWAVGSLLGPLFTEPFLSGRNATQPMPNTSYAQSNSQVITPLTISTYSKTLETRIWIPYTIAGVFFVISAVACSSIYLTSKNKSLRIIPTKNTTEDKKHFGSQINDAPLYRNTVVILMFFFVMLFCLLELTYPNYLTAYSVDYLNWSKSDGAFVTAAFWAAYSIGRVMNIFIIMKLSPTGLLIIGCVGIVIFSIPIPWFVSSHQAVLWVCSIGIGVSLSPVFPTTITWTNDHLTMTGPIMSTFVAATTVGQIIGPIIVGTLIVKYTIGSFSYLILSSSALIFLSFLILLLASAFTNKITRSREIR